MIGRVVGDQTLNRDPAVRRGFFVVLVTAVMTFRNSLSPPARPCTILADMNPSICLAVALAVTTTPAFAVICKTIDADGVVSYSEIPAAECPQAVKLPDYSRYEPRELPSSIDASATATDLPFTGYSAINIVLPEQNGTVRNNQGQVQVNIEMEPELQPGHRIKLFLDGGAVQGEFDGPSIQLAGVNRGTHTLRAVVSDASGQRLGDSPSVRFTLRQTTIFDRERTRPPSIQPVPPIPENPIEPTPENPIEPVPENPIEPAPESPADANGPNFSPPSGGIPATPGRTNPAFAPKFNP